MATELHFSWLEIVPMPWQHDVQGPCYFCFFRANPLQFYGKLNVKGCLLYLILWLHLQRHWNTHLLQEFEIYLTTLYTDALLFKNFTLNLNCWERCDFHCTGQWFYTYVNRWNSQIDSMDYKHLSCGLPISIYLKH